MKNMRCTYWLSLLMALICSTSVAADTVLYQATYKGEFSGWNISLDRMLVERDGDYLFQSKASNLFASISEQSTFTISDNYIRPSTYKYERKIFGRKTTETIQFDWDKGSAEYNRSNRPKNRTVHKLTKPFLDPALYQLNLQADLANGRYALEYEFLKRKKQKQYAFIRQAEDKFNLDGNAVDAMVVSYEGEDKSTRVWLLADYGYVIAKIVHRDDDGDTYELELAELKIQTDLLMKFYERIKLADPKASPDKS